MPRSTTITDLPNDMMQKVVNLLRPRDQLYLGAAARAFAYARAEGGAYTRATAEHDDKQPWDKVMRATKETWIEMSGGGDVGGGIFTAAGVAAFRERLRVIRQECPGIIIGSRVVKRTDHMSALTVDVSPPHLGHRPFPGLRSRWAFDRDVCHLITIDKCRLYSDLRGMGTCADLIVTVHPTGEPCPWFLGITATIRPFQRKFVCIISTHAPFFEELFPHLAYVFKQVHDIFIEHPQKDCKITIYGRLLHGNARLTYTKHITRAQLMEHLHKFTPA